MKPQANSDLAVHPKMYLYRRIVLAKQFIDQNYHKPIELSQISDCACLSKFHFLRQFKLAYGMSPHRYLTQVRVHAARAALRQGASVSSTCLSVGFESLPSFTHFFKKHVGLTPSRYARLIQLERKKMKALPLSKVPLCFADRLRSKSNFR